MSLFQELTATFLNPALPETRLPAPFELLIALSRMTDLLEGRPLRHAQRVAFLCFAFATELQFGERDRTDLLVSALLHDVGLFSVAPLLARCASARTSVRQCFFLHRLERVRLRPSKAPGEPKDPSGWDPEEPLQALLDAHVILPDSLVEAFSVTPQTQKILLQQHECWDGSGYPQHLSGERIDLGARILGLADTLEVLLSEQQNPEKRLATLEQFVCSDHGERFDPVLIAITKSWTTDYSKASMLLSQLYGLEVDTFLRQQLSQWETPLTAPQLLRQMKAIGTLTDGLMPGFMTAHSEKLAFLATQMARELGIDAAQTGELICAAYLANVGKSGLPIEQQLLGDSLGHLDWKQFYEHPNYNQAILKQVSGFERVTEWTGDLYERLNGSGYPYKKKSLEISLGGRLLGIAHVFISMTSPRPYRPYPYEPMDAIALMMQGRQRLYDANLLATLKRVVLSSGVEAFRSSVQKVPVAEAPLPTVEALLAEQKTQPEPVASGTI